MTATPIIREVTLRAGDHSLTVERAATPLALNLDGKTTAEAQQALRDALPMLGHPG